MDMPIRNTLHSLSPSITKMIRTDHSHVTMLAHRYAGDTSPTRRKAIADLVCLALEIHAQLEEEIFYPALREIDASNAVLEKSRPEHDEMRRLIGQLRALDPSEPQHEQAFHQLMRNVMHHVADEEAELLPTAERKLSTRLHELGAQMTRRRLQLAAPHAGEMVLDHARAMPAATLMLTFGIALTAFLLGRAVVRQRMRY
jgi:hemerythrin superfamily protein